MCTGISFVNNDFYFGRNLDLEYHFGEKVVITPRNYPLSYKHFPDQTYHFAMIGMATVMDNYPLYADAMNEHGLGMAGLNFPGYAKYSDTIESGKNNIAPYEIIPWTLAQFKTVSEVKESYKNLNLVNVDFKKDVPVAPLHWLIADKYESVVLEMTKEGLKLYDNPVGILTNNPTFDFHITNLKNYMGLSAHQPQNKFTKSMELNPLGQGTGGIGLPGDCSPASRFIKAVFVKENSYCEPTESANVSQFFHILDSVAFVQGTVVTPDNKYDTTIYSCCINGRTGDYYYKTYTNNQISVVSMRKENLEENELISYDLAVNQVIACIN
ncbi:choloylglycine hydrolase [Enterococcus faecalis]|uniref:choloylglycine hydrolase n=1 Tax=Enterococcus faecalis TaxID=1351 RepID=UPI0021E06B47|nr:choloylglycine hydrolase [Enterococcus faecalis]MCU9764250.1 choloylglycine hydrolase [Enterococcus faecalis]